MERTILIVDNNKTTLNILREKLLNTFDNINIVEATTYKNGWYGINY